MSNIENTVNRFLSWKLPADFSPDAGISFKPYHPQQTPENPMWPTGTNLLTHEQAKAMFEYVLDGAQQPQAECRSDGRCQYAIDHGAEGIGHCPKGKCVMPQQAEVVPPGFKHVCYLWVNRETLEYEVDHATHPLDELIPAYIAAAPKGQP